MRSLPLFHHSSIPLFHVGCTSAANKLKLISLRVLAIIIAFLLFDQGNTHRTNPLPFSDHTQTFGGCGFNIDSMQCDIHFF